MAPTLTLLDSKLGDHDVEGLVEHTDDGSGANDRSIALGQVGDEDAEEEVSRLLLSESCGILLHVASLSHLGDGLSVESELGIVSCESRGSGQVEHEG